MDKQDETPTQQLAGEIVDALIEAKVLDEKHREDVAKKVMLGNPSSDDWSLWVEMATVRDGGVNLDDAQD